MSTGTDGTWVTILWWTMEVPSSLVGDLIMAVALLVLPLLGLWWIAGVQRSMDQRPTEPNSVSVAVDRYLDALSGSLGLPAGIVADVRSEIGGHLTDTIDGLVADGSPRAMAVMEALRRLGPAQDLAVAIRHAQQTRRRLFAGIGGGIVTAPLGLAVGIWLALGVALLLMPVVLTPLSMLEGHLAAGAALRRDLATTMVTLTAQGVMFGVAARLVVRGAAAVSRRPATVVGRVVAFSCAPALGLLVLFVLPAPQAWMVIPFQFLPAIGVAVGATLRIDGPLPHIRRRTVLAGVLVYAITVVTLVLPVTRAEADGWLFDGAVGLEVLPPPAPVALLPQTARIAGAGMGARCITRRSSIAACTFAASDHEHPSRRLSTVWTDLRAEVWPATVDPSWPIGVDPTATAPIMTAPATRDGSDLVATVDIGMRRDGFAWWIVPTGIAPDGKRYRLSDGDGVEIPFHGTIWEWLTAPA